MMMGLRSGAMAFRLLPSIRVSRPVQVLPQGPSRRCVHVCAKGDEDDDEDDEAPAPGKALRVERLLANLGYGKRKECQYLVQKGRAVRRDGKKLKVGDKVLAKDIVLDDEELDPAAPVVVMLNKPVGYVVTAPDDDRIPDPKVYDLLPYRFGRRRPFLACVGRLDKATSGLLLLTDDGQLVHRINSPKKGIWKVYEATLAAPLQGKEAEAAARRFASGTLTLQGDFDALLPAKLEMLGECTARVSICEGRYHQIRRMFTAIGHEVLSLHRATVGGLSLGDLPSGEWKYLTAAEVDVVFSGPTTDDVMGASTAAADTPRQLPAASSSSSSSRKKGDVESEPASEEEGEEGFGLDEALPGDSVKKMKDDERWKRRRAALKKMVGNM